MSTGQSAVMLCGWGVKVGWERLPFWSSNDILGMEGVACVLKRTQKFWGLELRKKGYSTFGVKSLNQITTNIKHYNVFNRV